MVYAGIVKKHGNVAKGTGGRPPDKPPDDVRRFSPTTTKKVATDLGISDDAVYNRVARAAEAAGEVGVTIERTDGDTLIAVGEKALANAPRTVAARKQKRAAAQAAANARTAATKAQKQGTQTNVGTVTASPIDAAPLIDLAGSVGHADLITLSGPAGNGAESVLDHPRPGR